MLYKSSICSLHGSDILNHMTVKSTSIYGVYFDAQSRVLLVKDSNSSMWGFPGGGVEEDEAHDDTLRREFLEETGMEAQGGSAYITSQEDTMKQRHFYTIEMVRGNLSKNGNGIDVESAAYFDVSKLPLSDLAPGVENIVKHCRSLRFD